MTPAEDRYALTETQTLDLHEQGFVGPLTLWESSEMDAVELLRRLVAPSDDAVLSSSSCRFPTLLVCLFI